MTFFNRWAVVIGSSLIMWAVSERVFWSFWRPDETITGAFVTFCMYSMATYVALLAIEHFRVSGLPALIIVGALYGWIVEGIIAMTVFGLGGIPLPFSLSWTALAWHMPFSVVVLWWWHRRVLVASFWASLQFACWFGLAWGLWSMTWFFETPPLVTTVPAFALHALSVTALMVCGHVIMGRAPARFTAPRFEQGCIVLGLGLFFVLVTIPTIWYASIVIPLLGLAVFLPLRHSRMRSGEVAVIFQELTVPVPLYNLMTLAAAPAIATGIYALMLNHQTLLLPINYVVLVVATVGGFLLFGWAWRQIYKE